MVIHGYNTGSIQTLATRLHDCDVSLRWGGPQVAGAINGECHLMDGLEQLQTLQAANIPIPQFVVNADYGINFEGLWLARRRNHTQGSDIIQVGQHIRGRRPWRRSDYFVKYIPAVREWRFHILNGDSIARGLKYYTGLRNNAGPIPNQPDPIIRSRRLGWHLNHEPNPPKALRQLAKSAVAAIGYDLAAVDLLELEDGSGVVLECNSRPAIRDEYTLTKYEQAFRSL